MKKILKRLLTATVTLATLFPSLPATQVHASSNSVVRLETHPQYGYEFDNAMATQTMVWVITGGQYGTSRETRNADNLLQDNPTARSIYNQIRANMESYDTISSFTASSAGSAKDYEMKYNMNTGKFDLTLEDSRNALKYFDFSASGVSVQRTGNKLVFSSPTDKQFDTITLKAIKNLPKDVLPSLISGTPEFWLNPTQQNFASLDVSGSREAVPAYFKLHTEKIGHIKLKKLPKMAR